MHTVFVIKLKSWVLKDAPHNSWPEVWREPGLDGKGNTPTNVIIFQFSTSFKLCKESEESKTKYHYLSVLWVCFVTGALSVSSSCWNESTTCMYSTGTYEHSLKFYFFDY